MADEIRSDLPPRPSEEIAPPDPNARNAFESREDYQGYKMPPGMSLPQRRAYKKAIDERENFRSKAARQLPQQAEDYVIEPIKGVGRSAADVGKSLLEAATVVPRTKAAIAADPEGAQEFASRIMSGDRDAIREAATEASEGIAEPLATFGDVTLGGMAAQEGKFGEAAMYGGLVLAPGILQTLGKSMSKGWLKSAAEAGEEIPDDAAKKLENLAKRVDEGRVVDDMQARREIAMIEDTYKAEHIRNKADAKRSVKDLADEVQGDLSRLSYAGRYESGSYLEPDAGEYEEMIFERISDRLRNRPEIAEELRKRATSSKYTADWEEPFDQIGGFDPDAFPFQGGKPPGGGGRYRYPNLMNDLRSDLSNTDGGPLVDQNQARATMDRLFEIDQNEKRIRNTGKNAFGEVVDNPESELRRLDDQRIKVAEEYYNNKAVRLDKSGRSIDDIEGPSEAEVQQMIEQGRFGDPEELEMLKEDMRRMAELQQQGQVERSNIRRSRTPGTPGESGKAPEGTSRAERRGTSRERPKKK